MPLRQVVLLSNQPTTLQAVTAALDSSLRLNDGNVCRDLPTLNARLEKAPSSAALVDLDVPGLATSLSDLEGLIRRYGDTRFILLTNELRPELLLEAMQVGARHVLLKRAILADLMPTLRRLCGPTVPAVQRGSAVTILSAGGGCGATTLAVNLAHELAEASAQPTLLCDLDWYYSPIPAYLGLYGQFGLLELLARADAIDSDLISTTVLTYGPHLQVLSTSNTAELSASCAVPLDRLQEVLIACKEAYRYVVLDAPRLPQNLTWTLAKASTLVFIVFQLTIKDLRAAKLLMAALMQAGLPEDNLIPVAGRYRKRHLMITADEAARALNRPAIELLANDYLAVTQAINFGQPLAKAAPRAALRKDVQRLAQTVLKRSAPVPAGVTTR